MRFKSPEKWTNIYLVRPACFADLVFWSTLYAVFMVVQKCGPVNWSGLIQIEPILSDLNKRKKSWKVAENLPSSSSVFRSTLYAVYMVAQKCGPVNSILGESVISSVREPFFRGIYEHLFECQKCRLPGPGIFSQLFVLKTDPGRAGRALKIRAEILLQVIVLVTL